MKLLGIRFCQVSEAAAEMADFLENSLGLAPRPMVDSTASEFNGAVFPAGGGDSWIEIWPVTEGMSAGVMLQLVVDDIEAMAAHARSQGLDVHGPVDAHGERIYYAKPPTGLAFSFQSPWPRTDEGVHD